MTAPNQGTAPVARALARATTARDVERLRAHPDVGDAGWEVAYDGDVLVMVTLRARAAHYEAGKFDTYVVTLDCDSYDTWPPEVKFVDPTTGTYAVGADQRHLPNVQNFPNFYIHPAFASFFTPGRVDQLVCFSYARGYYDSSHVPQGRERWVPGRHWLYTTLRVLHRALQPPHYQGKLA